MGRPVVTTDVGILPEHVVTPPEMPEDVRTGWVVKPGDAKEFAGALQRRACRSTTPPTRRWRARPAVRRIHVFARSVAVATRAVYTSLLARDT